MVYIRNSSQHKDMTVAEIDGSEVVIPAGGLMHMRRWYDKISEDE